MARPHYRYETSSLELNNESAPVYPNAAGMEFYSYALRNPKLMVVERGTPVTSVRWRARNCRGYNATGERFDLWGWWDTTLNRGEYPMTVIDHRKRMLFDCSWNQWKERWGKHRGGLSDVTMDLDAPFGWLPPAYAAYLMTGQDVDDHCLDTVSDLVLTNGVLVNWAADHNILRKNGYALRVCEHPFAFYGARNNAVKFETGKGNPSASLFCQVRVPRMDTQNMALISVGDENYGVAPTNRLRIFVGMNDANTNWLKFGWRRRGFAEEVVQRDDMDIDTWYDVCLTYDGIASNFYGYSWPSATGTAWATTDDFLNGSTAVTDGIQTQTGPTNVPDNTYWTTMTLLAATAGGVFVTDSPMSLAYLQNAFVFDDFVSPMEFNHLRRLCHMWNNKTTYYPK